MISCIKDKSSPPSSKPILPAETQVGKNTLGCLLNGEVWLPYVPPNFSGVYAISVDYDNGYFYIKGTRSNNNFSDAILISKNKIYSTGNFVLSEPEKGNYARYLNLSKNCDESTDSNNLGQLTISRFDTINGIFSGKFNFTVQSKECGILKITEGRFDLKL